MIRKLANQTAIYGLSTIIPRLINYILTPYLTYYALNKMEFGVMSYFYATIPFGLSILTLGMENAYFKFTGKHESTEEKQKIFNTSISFIITLSAMFIAGVIWFQDSIFALLNKDFAESIITITATIIVFDAISAIPFARLREQQDSIKFMSLKIISVLINVFLAMFFYSVLPHIKDMTLFGWMWIENFGAGYVLLSNSIASGVIMLILILSEKNWRFSIDKQMLKTILVFSIPLFVSGLAGTANEFIDRQMMAILIPADESLIEIGIYTATLKVASLMVIFTQMYRYAAEPLFLSKMTKTDFKKNNAEAVKVFWIVSMTIFLVITLFIDIFQNFVGESFRGGMSLIPIMIISNILLGVQLNLSFWYKVIEKTHYALYITLAGLGVNVIFNMFFMESMGYTAAAIAKCLGLVVMVIISYVLNQIHYPINYNLKRIAEYTILTAILFSIGKHINIDNFILDNLVNLALLLTFMGWSIYREKVIKRLNHGNKSN